MSVHLSTSRQLPCRAPGQALLRTIGFCVAGAFTPWTVARAPAIGALAAITRTLAHRALARSAAHLALHLMFRHDALYSTELPESSGLNRTDRQRGPSARRRHARPSIPFIIVPRLPFSTPAPEEMRVSPGPRGGALS